MGFYEYFFGEDENSEPASMYGFTEETAAQEAEKYAVDIPEITWRDVGNVALDFTPIIGDIKGGYETIKIIGEELEREEPNYYLIGALGGLGAVGTIVGLVPGAGDAAQKAIMEGARMAADRANKLVDSLPEYDPNTLGSMGGNLFANRKPADKALKNELDPAGLSKTRLDDYADQIPKQTQEKGNLVDKKPVTIDELQQENAVLIPAQGDRSATDQTLTGVGDYEFDEPVDLDGGRGFMRNPFTGLWASDDTVAGKMVKLANRIAEQGGNPNIVYASMAGQSGDFNSMMSDTVMEMIKKSDIDPKKAASYDKWVRENVDPNWTGILNPDTKEYLRLLPEEGGMGGTKRRLLWQELDKGHYQDAGFPQIGLARIGITEDELLMSPKLETSSVGRVDATGDFLYGPNLAHNTYKSQVPGQYRGELQDAPLQLLMRDFFEARRSGGYKRQDDQRSLGFQSNTIQPVDQQMVDEVNTYLSIIEQAERDAYLRSLPSGGGETPTPQTYSFGHNGGPPLDDQMDQAFGDALQIGRSQAADGGALLKGYTAEDTQMLEQLSVGATAGTRKADALINAPVEEGTKVGIRLNLNSKIPDAPKGRDKLQTLHKNNFNGTAMSYVSHATVENVTFNVSQSGRAGIAAKMYAPDTPEAKNKFPAMSVDGNYKPDRNVLEEMDDSVVEIGFNPMNLHLFIDMNTGQAVESADVATVVGDRVYAKGVKYMKKADAPEPKPASDGTILPSEVRFRFNRGGYISA